VPASAAGKPIEVWFQDEARVGQKGSLEYIWAPVGSRPPMVRDNRHDSAYLFGAICHARQVGAAIIMPTVAIMPLLAFYFKTKPAPTPRPSEPSYPKRASHCSG
jgi:hypothetical protein